MEAAAPYTGMPRRSVLVLCLRGKEGRNKKGRKKCPGAVSRGRKEGKEGAKEGRKRKEGRSVPGGRGSCRAAPPAGARRYRRVPLGHVFLPTPLDMRDHLRADSARLRLSARAGLCQSLAVFQKWMLCVWCSLLLCLTVPAEELLSVMVSIHC